MKTDNMLASCWATPNQQLEFTVREWISEISIHILCANLENLLAGEILRKQFLCTIDEIEIELIHDFARVRY